MKQFRHLFGSHFFVICVLLIMFVTISAHTEDATKGALSKSITAVSDRFDIYGTVTDATPYFSQDYFTKLEQAAASGSEQEFRQALKDIRPPQPVPKVMVKARSESATKIAITDAQGKFAFISLPSGIYEVSAEMALQPPMTGTKRMAIAKERVIINRNCAVDLHLRTDLVSVIGRITDTRGRPVANAKVTAIEDFDDPGNTYAHKQWTTVSSADGVYELQGLFSPDIYRIANYLCKGDHYALNYVNIHVEAHGFVQSKESVLKVPLLTEELLESSRRLLKSLSRMVMMKGGSELQEKKDITFPSIHGNTITGIDVVLQIADKPK